MTRLSYTAKRRRRRRRNRRRRRRGGVGGGRGELEGQSLLSPRRSPSCRTPCTSTETKFNDISGLMGAYFGFWGSEGTKISHLTTFDCKGRFHEKKVAVLLDFFQMRGGTFLATFHKLYIGSIWAWGWGGRDPCPKFLAHWR